VKQVFCVRDRKAQLFDSPFFDVHKAQAMRAFDAACKNKDSKFALHPDDWELCYMGSFEESSGKFKLLEFPEILAQPRDYIAGGPVQVVSSN